MSRSSAQTGASRPGVRPEVRLREQSRALWLACLLFLAPLPLVFLAATPLVFLAATPLVADEPGAPAAPAVPGTSTPHATLPQAPDAGEAASPAAVPAAEPSTQPFVIGLYALSAANVVDGDTLRVSGERPVRLLGLDCEEAFRDQADRQAAGLDFAAYARAKRGDSPTPVKFGTPAGEAAREFVRALFTPEARVRLERDALGGHDWDGFDRRLAHALLITPAGERNLSVEVVRAGHSPYFVKYGRTRRWHADFVAAQAEARAHKRGIWADTGPGHYPDYDERLLWWEQRALQVDAWRAAPASPSCVELGTTSAAERLAALVGQEAVVFGSVGRMRLDGWPRIFWLTHRRGADLPVVVSDAQVWEALDSSSLGRRFVTVTGPVSLYRGKPQIEVSRPEQVSTR